MKLVGHVNEEALAKAWCKETAYRGNFDPLLPEKGQCAPTALLVNDLIGGELRGCIVGRSRHFYNHVAGDTYDYTCFQFDSEKLKKAINESAYRASRYDLLKVKNVRTRYYLLQKRYNEALEELKK